MDGLILVDKPQGLTSHDVVSRLRRILGLRQVGHFGTLDPLATGLLLVGIGKATRLFPILSRQDKAYRARIRLGLATDTYDAEGQPISLPCQDFPDEKRIVLAMGRLSGTIEQVPPPYSAKKVKGKPLYKWARAKKPVELRPHRVTVYSFRLTSYVPPDLDVEIECGSGTYIRSLAHDLGQVLGCGAHLTSLCRTRVGSFELNEAVTIDRIQAWTSQKKMKKFLRPLESLLEEWPKLILHRSQEKEIAKGRAIEAEQVAKLNEGKKLDVRTKLEEPVLRLFSFDGRFIGLARPEKRDQKIIPFLLIR